MTKEEHIEALKEAKKWEKEQETKMKNAQQKVFFYPMFYVAIFTIFWVSTIGVKHSTPKAMLLYFLSFILFNASAIYHNKQYVKEAKELGLSENVSSFGMFGNAVMFNLITGFIQFLIIVPQT